MSSFPFSATQPSVVPKMTFDGPMGAEFGGLADIAHFWGGCEVP